MHGAQILPRFSFRKALRTEGKRSWVSQAHFVLRPTVPPPWLRTSAAAVLDHGSCRSVAGGANPWQSVLRRASSAAVRMRVLSCGIRPPAACVLPTASARPQQPSPPALLGGRAPNDSRMSSWRIPLHSRYPHLFGRRPPRRNTKNGQRLLAVFSRL